jgi:hypothetical protein
MKRLFYLLFFISCWYHSVCNGQKIPSDKKSVKILTGADQTNIYFSLLKGKKVALFANPTSVIEKRHLLDTLISSGINVTIIFGPEHGFRGKADAGEHIDNDTDTKTGIPVISLYGNHKKPTKDDLKNVEVMLFDIQDIGVRFYTFISSLQYYMEAAFENNKQLIILDRPNPNGFYVDGPVLDTAFRSFIGMQPVPIVYGMTIGEYAKMLIGEKWIKTKSSKNMIVIPCKNYTHESKYILPVNPSPNLREMQSIYLYPSICFFEGTVMSEGRGTDKPFQIFGHPSLPSNLYSFTPKPNEGAKSSKCFNEICYGWNLSGSIDNTIKLVNKKIQLKYLLEAYKLFQEKDSFFLKNNFINKLAGNDILMNQIKKGISENEIRKSWQPKLKKFKAIRKKYLLYPDFKE